MARHVHETLTDHDVDYAILELCPAFDDCGVHLATLTDDGRPWRPPGSARWTPHVSDASAVGRSPRHDSGDTTTDGTD